MPALLVCSLAAIQAAEVRVFLSSKENRFVPGESIPLQFTLRNLSGKDFQMGDSIDWLDLRVESDMRSAAFPIKPIVYRTSKRIPNAGEGKMTVDLGEFFRFTETGRYKVRAYVKSRDFEPVFVSYPDFQFDIVPPSTIWSTPIGYLPPGESRPIPREFKIQKITRARTVIFARVGVAGTGELINLVSLGELVTARQPVKRIDRFSNLHVLHQSGAREFTYHIISPKDGKLLRRRSYAFADGRAPVLDVDENGQGQVTGGLRIRRATDIGHARKLPDRLPPAQGAD